jgi:hypothetical protein
MNKERRKKLDEISKALESINSDLKRLLEEEKEYLNNLQPDTQNGVTITINKEISECACVELFDVHCLLTEAISGIRFAKDAYKNLL